MDQRPQDPARLSELRAQIDAIDESVHRLLMQRASVIDELIRVKGTARNGAAFRPGREADMMRRLAARHSGPLPLTSVEHLWREIISTFTALQAPYDVAVSLGADPVAAMDAARFSFGFSVPVHALASANEVVARIEEGGDRLGLVLCKEEAGAWWESLRSGQIVARLPFVEAEGRQAGEPALVLSPPLADPVPFEIGCFVVWGNGDLSLPEGTITLARAPTSRLVAVPGGADRLSCTLGEGLDIRPVGGYAAPLIAPR